MFSAWQLRENAGKKHFQEWCDDREEGEWYEGANMNERTYGDFLAESYELTKLRRQNRHTTSAIRDQRSWAINNLSKFKKSIDDREWKREKGDMEEI